MTHPEDPSQTPDATASDPASPRPPRRAVLAVGTVLVLGGIALAIWAVTATGSTAPEAQPTSAGTVSTASTPPAAEAAPTPAPAASTPLSIPTDGPVISAFSVEPAVAACPDDRASTLPLTFSWTSESAERAWIGVGTSDASAQPAAEVDLSSAGFSGLVFACSDADQVFTLTVQGATGTVSETISLTRELD
ncbi:hypothetical protein FHS07_001271 [Microbacterium proteolyticum]|uniref:Uncharacterized protein n=1 Tax=Microbacterium proteolyticum TaxID=1572644 RepID=A0A7W5GFV4_9MICO|nr:hypothetical protein [Microbacterium proteolyticum]MBB3157587.1 hypothetical protein [Microbacterium proteolyticum]